MDVAPAGALPADVSGEPTPSAMQDEKRGSRSPRSSPPARSRSRRPWSALLTGSLAILSEAAHSLIDLRRDRDDLFRGAHLRQAGRRGASLRPRQGRERHGAGRDRAAVRAVRRGDLGGVPATAWRARPCGRGDDLRPSRHRRLDRGRFLPRARCSTGWRSETSSEALEADALHFGSDMWSSIAVLVGLAGVALGYPGRTPPRRSSSRSSSASPAGGSAAAPSTR